MSEWTCPYPECEWAPSRSVDSEVRLTQVIVNHEVEEHRSVHKDGEGSEGDA